MKLTSGLAVLAMLIATISPASACAKPQGEGVASAGGSGQTQTDPNAPAADPEERVRQFVACMRAEGLDIPDPQPGDRTGKSALRFEGTSIDKSKFGPAMEKCGKYLPDGGENGRLSPEQIEQLRAFAQCMRDNGMPSWPDPDADGKFPNTAINKDDPALREALEKCRQNVKPRSSASNK